MIPHPKSSINILYIIDHFYGIGGTENHLANLVTSLDRNKFKCIVVVFDFLENSLARRIRQTGIQLIHVPVGHYYTYDAFRKAWILSRIIKENAVDIVQTYHIKSDFYGALIAHLSGAKIIISSKRDTGELKSRWHFFLNKLVRGITCRYIVVADAIGRAIVEREGVSPEKIVRIYNGVDVNKFAQPSPVAIKNAKNHLGFAKTDFVVGSIAWLRPEKNYNIFFDAIKNVFHKIGNMKVVVVGGDEDGVQSQIFKKYVAQARIAEHVVFAGQVTDVRPYLKAFDVACLVPGRNEGFSNSILEEMSMGLPMIVTEVGGNPEAVVDGFNGFVIPPNNSERLAEKLLYLAENPRERQVMGIRSAQRVRKMFPLGGMIRAHEELYESLMDKWRQN